MHITTFLKKHEILPNNCATSMLFSYLAQTRKKQLFFYDFILFIDTVHVYFLKKFRKI